jgi:hypothetical protein
MLSQLPFAAVFNSDLITDSSAEYGGQIVERVGNRLANGLYDGIAERAMVQSGSMFSSISSIMDSASVATEKSAKFGVAELAKTLTTALMTSMKASDARLVEAREYELLMELEKLAAKGESLKEVLSEISKVRGSSNARFQIQSLGKDAPVHEQQHIDGVLNEKFHMTQEILYMIDPKRIKEIESLHDCAIIGDTKKSEWLRLATLPIRALVAGDVPGLIWESIYRSSEILIREEDGSLFKKNPRAKYVEFSGGKLDGKGAINWNSP